MKTIILNGSPRKNWNTALMLKEAQKGAESVGAETEYIDLFDLAYTGCRSCLACKRKDAKRCKCFWKDDLSPVIDRIFAADTLIIGSPIYLGDITSQVHGLIERLRFCTLSYDNYSNYCDPCQGCNGPDDHKPEFCAKFCGIILCQKRRENGYTYCDELRETI